MANRWVVRSLYKINVPGLLQKCSAFSLANAPGVEITYFLLTSPVLNKHPVGIGLPTAGTNFTTGGALLLDDGDALVLLGYRWHEIS